MGEFRQYEGSLRSSTSPNGSIKYWCEVENYGIPITLELSPNITLTEARHEATRLELEAMHKKVTIRNSELAAKSIDAREMIGSPEQTPVGAFLCRELEIQPSKLTADQREAFLMTVLKMSLPGIGSVKKSDMRACASAIGKT